MCVCVYIYNLWNEFSLVVPILDAFLLGGFLAHRVCRDFGGFVPGDIGSFLCF